MVSWLEPRREREPRNFATGQRSGEGLLAARRGAAIMSHDPCEPANGDYDGYITCALATEGGHLSIGRGGFTLWYARGCRLSGYEREVVKAAAIAAGLPVIDSRAVAFEVVAALAIGGPMVAVGEPASPAPWHSLSYAPLAYVVQAYREAGAEVFNIPGRLLEPRDAPIVEPAYTEGA